MSFFSNLFKFGSHNMAIDLGTANTLVYVQDQGIILDEPSVVAIETINGIERVKAVGDDAKMMMGKTPDTIKAVRPLRDGVIAGLGYNLETSGEVIDARGCVITPGLVNTHHHLYQTLTRAVPGGQDALLFGWLQMLYPIWSRMGPQHLQGLAPKHALALLSAQGQAIADPFGGSLQDYEQMAQEVEEAVAFWVRKWSAWEPN